MQALDVELESLLRGGLAAVVDGDADGGSELAGDAGGLLGKCQCFLCLGQFVMCGCVYVVGSTSKDLSRNSIMTCFNLSSGYWGFSYLQLLQSKTSASTCAAVVLEGRALNHGAQTVDGAGSHAGGFGDTGISTTVLAAGLFEVHLDPTLPVLVEVPIRDDVVVLDRLEDFEVAVSEYSVESTGRVTRCAEALFHRCALTILTTGNHNNRKEGR